MSTLHKNCKNTACFGFNYRIYLCISRKIYDKILPEKLGTTGTSAARAVFIYTQIIWLHGVVRNLVHRQIWHTCSSAHCINILWYCKNCVWNCMFVGP